VVTEEAVTVVRIYLREKQHKLNDLMEFLKSDQNVAGVTVFRGIAGFSGMGEVHTTSLLALSLDLPLVLEFFDEPDKAVLAADRAIQLFGLNHVISFPATRLTAKR
jgi:PII-like signaling protein